MRDTYQETDPGEKLIARVASRVSAARKERGLPRRVVSERSGVSPRYLAQLEAGTGNISILLLARVAAALDLSVETLMSESEGPTDQETLRLAKLFHRAPSALQDEVRGLLAEHSPDAMRAGRICLIGLRGAGKSTLAAQAAEVLDLPFVELTADIEATVGMPMAEIMSLYGDDGFRRLEGEALERVSSRHDRVIIAVAGCFVEQETNFENLLRSFHTVWVKASPTEHMLRVQEQGDVGPVRSMPHTLGQLNATLERRALRYGLAEVEIDTSNRQVGESLNDLLKLISERGFLDPA